MFLMPVTSKQNCALGQKVGATLPAASRVLDFKVNLQDLGTGLIEIFHQLLPQVKWRWHVRSPACCRQENTSFTCCLDEVAKLISLVLRAFPRRIHV
jgi:hypothetical protein